MSIYRISEDGDFVGMKDSGDPLQAVCLGLGVAEKQIRTTRRFCYKNVWYTVKAAHMYFDTSTNRNSAWVCAIPDKSKKPVYFESVYMA